VEVENAMAQLQDAMDHVHARNDAQNQNQIPNGVPAGEEAAPAPNVPNPPRPNRIRQRRDLAAFSTASLADTILGALIFPSIAAAVGELLRISLPKAWVTPPSASGIFGRATPKTTGFLQTRWGRSVLGGCLFVGVKDAVMLYVRWKMAKNHRKRSVLDYKGSKGRARGGGVRA
jgi:hypothetical protein